MLVSSHRCGPCLGPRPPLGFECCFGSRTTATTSAVGVLGFSAAITMLFIWAYPLKQQLLLYRDVDKIIAAQRGGMIMLWSREWAVLGGCLACMLGGLGCATQGCKDCGDAAGLAADSKTRPGDRGGLPEDSRGEGGDAKLDRRAGDLPVATGNGHVVYNLPNGRVYVIEAKAGVQPRDLTAELIRFGPSEKDEMIAISRNGKHFLLSTERFHEDCRGWGCLTVVPFDVSKGEAILVDGKVVHDKGQTAIGNGGDLVIYEDEGDNSPHGRDLFLIRKQGGVWTTPKNITLSSTYTWNSTPKLSRDESKVIFSCYPEVNGVDDGHICEVGVNGSGFRVILTTADSPSGLPKKGDLHHPDYAPDGSIVFESDWDGEFIWRLSPGATTPVKVNPSLTNDNTPCVLSDGRIVSLWLHRPGGQGYHELTVMDADGSNYHVILKDIDVLDVGIHCGD